MVDPKGLEAAARKLRNAEKEKFGSWPDADDSRSIAAAVITAYLSSVQAEPVAYVSERDLEFLRGGAYREAKLFNYDDEHRVPLYAALAEREPVAVGPEPAVADENKRLRAVISKVCDALPNGAFCSPNCSVEFMELVPGEVASVASALVATPPAERVVEATEEMAEAFSAGVNRYWKGRRSGHEGDAILAGLHAALAAAPAIKDDERVVEALPEGTLSMHGNDVVIQYAFHEQAQRAFDILEAALAAKDGRS